MAVARRDLDEGDLRGSTQRPFVAALLSLVAACHATPRPFTCAEADDASSAACLAPAALPTGYRAYRARNWAVAAPSAWPHDTHLPRPVGKDGKTTLEMGALDPVGGQLVALVVELTDGPPDLAAAVADVVKRRRAVATDGKVEVVRGAMNGRESAVLTYDDGDRRQWSLLTVAGERRFELVCSARRSAGVAAHGVCMTIFASFVVR